MKLQSRGYSRPLKHAKHAVHLSSVFFFSPSFISVGHEGQRDKNVREGQALF